MQFALNLRMLGQQIPRPCQSIGGRLVTGKDQRHHLVMQLLIAHSLACLLITSKQKHGEQVASIGSLLPVLSNDVIYHRIKNALRLPVLAIVTRGKTL